MAEDSIAQVELREKGGAPLHDGNLNSPNGHSAQAGSFPSSGGSGSKASPNPADCYWFAQSGDSPSETKQPSERDGVEQDGKDANFNKDREERVRMLREKQAEERHRKLEELKSAAMQAQKFREIQEEERRRKIEEIKYKDSERRHLVEERKRQIWEAEKDRRETILRKSQEREARIEAVRNSQRSSIGFAFGSSMPRLLDLETSLMVGRRSSSQTNVTLSPTTPNARSTINDQVDGEVVRKRTTSSYNLDNRNSDSAHRHTIHEAFFTDSSWPSLLANHDDSSQTSQRHQVPISPSLKPRCRGSTLIDFPWDTDNGDHQAPLIPPAPAIADHRLSGVLTGSGVLVGENIMTQSMSALSSSIHRGRRKTDLIPTMPPNRESPRTRSPGRAYSMTRLDQLSQPRKRPLEALREETNRLSPNMIKTKSMTHLAFRKGNRSATGVDGRSLRASRSADPRMSKSTSHLAIAPLSVANGRPLSARTSPTRPHLTSGSTSPGRSFRGSSPGSEGSAKRMSQSMWYLASPASTPRPTRTSILRRGALTQAQQKGMSRSMMHLVPKQKEDIVRLEGLPPRVAPASPSRPQSSMSQLSLSSHTSQSSTVSLRARSAPRRPRPLSVAGTIPDKQLNNEERQSRSSEKRAATPLSSKPPRAKSVGADQATKEMGATASGKPPVTPNPASRRPPSAGARTPVSKSTPAPSKEKPKIAPKPTMFRQGSKPSPVQSPTSEHPHLPLGKEPQNKVSESNKSQVKVEPASTLDKETVFEAPEVSPPSMVSCEPSSDVPVNGQPNGIAPTVEEQSVLLPIGMPAWIEAPKSDQAANDTIAESAAASQPKEEIKEKPQKEISAIPPISAQQEEATIIESGQTPSKPKITTEEEAKAAMAEKRRLAREQAEREAELERQRQEELRRQEEERIRREEEEQRLWEIEQERSRHAEEERLRKAIEEQQQREEEERLRKEEEAKQKFEKEKAERLAREEQEKIRKETEEKLRKEEEDRAERRKRVEAIMSRTRGKGGNNTPPVTTPTKSTELVLPAEEAEQQDSKTPETSITDSVEQNGRVDGPTMEMNESQMLAQPDLLGNIANTEMDKVNVSETNEGKHASLIEQQFTTKIETIFNKEHDVVESIHTNGFSHHETVDSQTDADLIMDSQSTPEKNASPLLDNLVEFDLLASNLEPVAPPSPSEVAQLIDLSLGTMHTTRNEVEHITNEDNVNFNIATNGLDSPFVDNYTRHQESTVTDFLS